MEHFFNCPYCGERISMVLDMTVRRQIYVEDCEVCCRPIQIRYTVVGSDIAEFNAKSANETN
jgi:transcription elongation factor Elf1